MRILSFYILIAISVCSCTKEIDLDYPAHESRLTLNCVITAGEPVKASLTSTTGFQPKSAPPYYKDALIILYENGQLVDTLTICESRYLQTPGDTAWFFCSDFPVAVGKTYMAKAATAGFPEVYGSTTVPAKGKILDIRSFEDEDFNTPYEITIGDAEAGDNFYIMYLTYEEGTSEPVLAQLTTEDPTVNLYDNYGIFRLPTDEVTGSRAFFTDEHFPGRTKTLTLRAFFTSGVEANGLVLYSVSREYYEHVRNLEINRAVGENPFAEPLSVNSNVVNGLGMVGAVNITKVRF